MAIATVIRTQAKMWGGHFELGEPMCTLQGFLMIYGGLSTFYWILSIAIVMYTMIFHPFVWFKEKNIIYCNRICIAFNFTVPVIFAILPVLTEDYAPTGGWCWISNLTPTGKAFRFAWCVPGPLCDLRYILTSSTHCICRLFDSVSVEIPCSFYSFYGQLLLILVFCIFAYCRIYFFLKFNEKAADLRDTHKVYHRIKYYPLCLILGFSVATVRRFIELWDVPMGFGVAMATSYVVFCTSNWSANSTFNIFYFSDYRVTTGLFGFFLLMVYGRLGKLNKLFKREYPCCIPICNVRDKIFGTQTEDENSTSAKTPKSGMNGSMNSKHKHVAVPLSPPSEYLNERTDHFNVDEPIGRTKLAHSKADLLREVARFHSEEKVARFHSEEKVARFRNEENELQGDEEGRTIIAKKWTIDHSEE